MYGREGGTFKLLLEFTEDYPNKPPVCSRMILFWDVCSIYICMHVHIFNLEFMMFIVRGDNYVSYTCMNTE